MRAAIRECFAERGMLRVSVWENSGPFMYHEHNPEGENLHFCLILQMCVCGCLLFGGLAGWGIRKEREGL